MFARQTEHAGAPAAIKVIELVGVSEKSWSDAAQEAVKHAARTLRHITGLDVLHSTAVVRDDKIVEYHVNVKVAFITEDVSVAPAC
jgi:flavin-binding protein dodecin